MEKMPLLGAPGYYCALGYWMAAVLFGYENKRKHTAGITVLLQIVFLVCIIIFSVVTDTNLAIYFLPCFAFAILLLFLMLYLTCEMPLNNICYFTIRSFILGEFTSSLEWQLEIYSRPGRQALRHSCLRCPIRPSSSRHARQGTPRARRSCERPRPLHRAKAGNGRPGA